MSSTDYTLKVKKALKLIEDNPTSKQYFFNNPDVNADWFDALKEAGAFNFASISNVRKIGDVIEYSRWPEAEYIVRVTSDIPSKILELLLEYDTTAIENPIIREKLILITKVLTAHLEEKNILPFLKRISEECWFESAYLNLSPYELKDLVDSLVSKKWVEGLNSLLTGVLKLTPPPKGSKYRQEPTPLFDVHTYEEVLNSLSTLSLEVKDKKEFVNLVNILSELLSKHIDIENGIKSHRRRESDSSTYWKPVLNEKGDRLHRDLDVQLFDCIFGLLSVNAELVDVELLTSLVKKHKYTIFKRLAIFIFMANSIEPNSIVHHILEWIKDVDTKNEIREFLVKNYKELSEENKNKILEALDSLLDVEQLFTSRQNAIKQGWVKDEAELRTQIEDYVTRSKGQYLKPIAQYLTSSQQVVYSKELSGDDDYTPYKFSTGGFKSGPNSRLSAEVISTSSVKDLVQLFKEDASWFIGNVHNDGMYSPLGVARAWDADIFIRPNEYLSNLDLFTPSADIPPNYTYHLFSGFEKVALEKKVPLPQLMEFLAKLLKQYTDGTLPEFPIKDDFDVGSWEETLVAILRFLEDAMKVKGVIDVVHSDTVWGVIEYALESQSDSVIKAHEDEYSQLDYDTYAINSIYGLALHCLFRFSIWKSEATSTKHSLSQETKNAITHELTRGIKTAYSVVAHYFPTIFYADKDFGTQIKATLFESENKPASYVALDAYLHNSVYKEIVQVLSENYMYFIENLEDLPDTRHGPGIAERLIDHVMVIFAHGLPNGTAMKKALFVKSDKVKEQAISFVGRAYISAEKKVEDAKVTERIIELWDECLKDGSLEYGKAFGWWIESGFFADTEWMLNQLIKTLKATNGIIDPDFRVLRTLADLSSQSPKLCLEALELMIKGRDSEKTYYFRDGEVSEIISNAESKNDAELDNLAEAIRNELVRYGFNQYRKKLDVAPQVTQSSS